MKKLLVLSVLFFSVTVLNAQVTSPSTTTELLKTLNTMMSEINNRDFDVKTYLQLEQCILDLEQYINDLSPSDDLLLSDAKTKLYQRKEAYKKETAAFSFTALYSPTRLKTLLVEYLEDIIDKKELNQMTLDDLIENAEYKMNEDENINTEETRNLKVKLFPYYVERVNTNVKETNNVMSGNFEKDILASIFSLSYLFDNLKSIQLDKEMILYYIDKLSQIIDLSATYGDPMYRIAKKHYKENISNLKTKFEGIRAVK